RLTILVYFAAFFAFALAPVTQPNDSIYSMLLSESILRHGSVFLDQHYRMPKPQGLTILSDPAGRPTYELMAVNGHVVYFFPHGSSFLSLPFVALMELAGLRASTSGG